MNELPGFSGPNRDFYSILEIEKTTDLKTIQKAYKKLALKYHPDKTADPEATEKFQAIKRAYDVLTDDKKRRIYDEYGERGVSMVESMGEVAPFIDPDIIFFLNWIFFFGSCLAALLILFPTFISLKADGSVNWPWINVFIPAFILDAFVLLVLLTKPSEIEPQDAEESSSDDKPKKVSNLLSKWLSVIYFVLLIIFQVFLATKLDATFDGSWWKVFAPLILMELSNFADLCLTVSTTFKVGYLDFTVNSDGTRDVHTVPFTMNEKSSIILDTFGIWTLRLLQIIFICLKLEFQVSSSWALVFLPTWLWGFLKLTSIWLWINDISTRPSKSMGLGPSVFGFIVSALFIYLTFGLLVSRLDNDNGLPKAAVILIPVFIVTGTLFCCLGCCLPLMTMGVRNALAHELKSDHQLVSIERRIEAGSSKD